MRIQNGVDLTRYTPVSIVLEAGDYTVSEFLPQEGNWMATTQTTQSVTVVNGQTTTVYFGNLCLGEGGGRPLGFWSNRNGQRLIGNDDLVLLSGLNLRNSDGTNFDPANYATFRTWLLGGNATNMAYMLSVQLAAMELNVFNGFVSADALIYAPGTTSANALGFATVGDVMAEAAGGQYTLRRGDTLLLEGEAGDCALRSPQGAMLMLARVQPPETDNP